MMSTKFSREYLEEVLALAKKELPGWAYAALVNAARPKAGGRSAHRIDEPSIFEKVALGEIRPSVVHRLSDDEIGMVWLRLNQWYANAKRRKQAIEDIVNAALWVMNEAKRRGIKIKSSDLTAEVENLKETGASKSVERRMQKLPKDVVLVRNFVAVVGSMAKGNPNPNDVDILIRAVFDKDDKAFQIKSENVWLPIRNALDPDKSGLLHWIDNAQGAHGDNIPLYDLILRRRDSFETHIVKAEKFKIDLGCGENKPDGYYGLDKNKGSLVDKVCDLEKGIPLQDQSVDVVRAFHLLEHLVDKDKIISEIYRVLKPGGLFKFEIPSTKSEGAFAHPDHKSFWNKTSFKFWLDPKVSENRPLFKLEELDEIKRGEFVYVKGKLIKPQSVEKALAPFQHFTPPKPSVVRFTELFDVDDLWKWGEKRIPIAVEPKLNGFRGVAHKQGDKIGLWFEGQIGKNAVDRIPGARQLLQKIPGPYVLDVDIAIKENGKRLPRPELMTLNSDKPEINSNQQLVITAFDAPYYEDDLTDMPFEDRREVLEKIKNVEITPIRWVRTLEQLKAAAKWAFGFDRSEGLMSKSAKGKYETDGSTNEWSKLKRVAEIKVIVLDKKIAGQHAYNYEGGLLKGDSEFEANDEGYVSLGNSFNTEINATKGDILTVEVLEIIPKENKLSWLGARVIDIDETRKQPYFAKQAIDIARRAQVLQKAIRLVPSHGPKNAPVAFVAASPGRVEFVRGEPLIGPAKETFEGKYLAPLNLKRSEVVLTNSVPVLLTDDRGRVREPNEDEIKKWNEWLTGELDRLKPQVIVALGQTTKKALADRCDIVIPHPLAIKRFGDSGELIRKLKQVKDLLSVEKQNDEGGGETRNERAERLWDEHWFERLPKSGKGKFVYQHHWRGLDENEAKLSDKQLLETDHSLHGDLRLEGDEGLFGFAVFLGRAQDNKVVGGDKFFDLKEKQNLRLSPKLLQPKQWLTVQGPVEPGGSGSTSNKWSRFFIMDKGTYEIGVCTQNSLEIFLDGQHLKGRYLIIRPRLTGERVWLIDKPQTQTPRAEVEDLADVIGGQRSKGRPYVVWAKPGERPTLYDTRKGTPVQSEIKVPISKADRSKHIVYGCVIDPYGSKGAEADAHDDWTPPAEVEKIAHDFLKTSRAIGLQHSGKAKAEVVESWVEMYPTQDDYLKAMNGEDHKVIRREFGDDIIHSGSWLMGVHLGDEEWKLYEDKEINAFSWGGFGIKTPYSRELMPKVTFVDLVAK